MEKIGILGGSGEVGSKVVELLKNTFKIKVSYNKNLPQTMFEEVEYYQLEISNEIALDNFIKECKIIVNCASSSFVNGINVAKVCSKFSVVYIDPFGADYLEGKIQEYGLKGAFILSCGCFPGMTGIVLKYLCEKFNNIDCISGINIDGQTPGINGIIDFALSGLRGFGEPFCYYKDKEKIIDNSIDFFNSYENYSIKVKKYFTSEIKRIINKYPLKKAIWYAPVLSQDITQIMQKLLYEYLKDENYEAILPYAKEIQEMIDTSKWQIKDCEINVKAFGKMQSDKKEISIILKSCFSGDMTAALIYAIVFWVIKNPINAGIYYADDVVDLPFVMGLSSCLHCYTNDEVLSTEMPSILYEEGVL